MEKQIGSLRNETKKIKSVISHIQCRNLSKNYLNCFNKYINKQDWDVINNKPEKRAEIYTERIKENFKEHLNNEKFQLLLKIINNSCNSLISGNSSAHSMEIKFYKEQLGILKDKKNINILKNTKIICFLIGIGIEIDSKIFDDALVFLTSEKFDDSLNINNWRINDVVSYLIE